MPREPPVTSVLSLRLLGNTTCLRTELQWPQNRSYLDGNGIICVALIIIG
jgi:hypothetical protein